MKNSLVLCFCLLFTGCLGVSEQKERSMKQLLAPDKMNMQLHVNPDIGHNERTKTEIQQLRIGFDWNL